MDAGLGIGGGDERPAELVGRGEIPEVVERGVSARGDEEDALAAAVDLRASGVVLLEPARQGVERDERLGERGLEDVRREEGRVRTVRARPVHVDGGRVAPGHQEVEVGEPYRVRRRRLAGRHHAGFQDFHCHFSVWERGVS